MTNNIQSIRNQLKFEIESSNQVDSWFVEEHLLVVERLALELCDHHPEANRDAVTLSVWFHDYSRSKGEFEEHDLHGAKYAKDQLTQAGFDQQFVRLVEQACLSHRSTHTQPVSIEAKILASADAMSHFSGGFYLRLMHRWSKLDYQDAKKKLLEKIERDYHDKLSVDEAKEAIKPLYDAWQIIIQDITI